MKPNRVKTAAAEEARSFRLIRDAIQSGRPLIYICSHEESRVRRLLLQAASQLFPRPVPVWSWSATAGLRTADGSDAAEGLTQPREVLEFILRHPHPSIFHLKDLHEAMRADWSVRRLLRDIYEACIETGKYVAISAPSAEMPEEISRQVAYIELLQPDLEEMLDFVGSEAARLAGGGFEVDRSEDAVFALARALQGLTLDEARHAMRRAVTVSGRLSVESVPLLLEEKKQIVNRSGLVQYIADGTRIDHVGGLENLKHWLTERRKLFVERESLSAEIVPKGLLVMGVSGCGKSLSVKAVASCFGLPLYRIDMIEVFSGRHGNPDAAFVQACRTVESLSPAVVWFDEIEMGLTGQTGETSTNLGRIFAYFLTWMQEKTRGLFVAATANRIDLLPAEIIRKGRFDEVFFIDLPTEEERFEIFRIHLARRGLDPAHLQLNRLKRITQGWTGAEIEQCVVSAITTVRLQDREITFDDIHTAALGVIPLSKTMKEQVEHIRSWAYDRAVRASPRER